MGNWTRVQVVGTCGASEVAELKKALDPGKNYENFHPLVCGGVCGLPNWAAENIDVTGNLAERDYGSDSVAETLVDLAKRCPSLAVKVHMGADYEADECVATITLKDGVATIGAPEVEKIQRMNTAAMGSNLMAQLMRGRTD